MWDNNQPCSAETPARRVPHTSPLPPLRPPTLAGGPAPGRGARGRAQPPRRASRPPGAHVLAAPSLSPSSQDDSAKEQRRRTSGSASRKCSLRGGNRSRPGADPRPAAPRKDLPSGVRGLGAYDPVEQVGSAPTWLLWDRPLVLQKPGGLKRQGPRVQMTRNGRVSARRARALVGRQVDAGALARFYSCGSLCSAVLRFVLGTGPGGCALLAHVSGNQAGSGLATSVSLPAQSARCPAAPVHAAQCCSGKAGLETEVRPTGRRL